MPSTLQVVSPLEGGRHLVQRRPPERQAVGRLSDDAFSLVVLSSTEGRATGLHTDPSHETFYVLEGTLLFHVDGEEHRAEAGATVAIRRGVPHAFLVLSATARFLVLNTPARKSAS